MGCDIHPHIEVESCGKWFYVGRAIERNRNYYFFSELCGVRGDKSEGFFELSHFSPEEFAKHYKLSEHIAKMCIDENGNGHSHVVGPYEDLIEFRKVLVDQAVPSGDGQNYALEQLDSWLDACKLYGKAFDKVRVVVWFDN